MWARRPYLHSSIRLGSFCNIAMRSDWEMLVQRAISDAVRPHPVHQRELRLILQIFLHGELIAASESRSGPYVLLS